MLNFRIIICFVLTMLSICMTTNARAQADFVITLGEQIEITSASGETNANFPASNVLDHDLNSRFLSNANPDDLFLDLGNIRTIDLSLIHISEPTRPY